MCVFFLLQQSDTCFIFLLSSKHKTANHSFYKILILFFKTATCSHSLLQNSKQTFFKLAKVILTRFFNHSAKHTKPLVLTPCSPQPSLQNSKLLLFALFDFHITVKKIYSDLTNEQFFGTSYCDNSFVHLFFCERNLQNSFVTSFSTKLLSVKILSGTSYCDNKFVSR